MPACKTLGYEVTICLASVALELACLMVEHLPKFGICTFATSISWVEALQLFVVKLNICPLKFVTLILLLLQWFLYVYWGWLPYACACWDHCWLLGKPIFLFLPFSVGSCESFDAHVGWFELMPGLYCLSYAWQLPCYSQGLWPFARSRL